MDAMTPLVHLLNAHRAASDARASYQSARLDQMQNDVVANAQSNQDAVNMVWNDADDGIRATNNNMTNLGMRLHILEGKVERILSLVQESMGHSTSTKNTREHGSGCADAQ
jgi:hypothetical protein